MPPTNVFAGTQPNRVRIARIQRDATNGVAAVFVEDRLLTLDKTMSDSTVNDRVVPVVASWGYNTPEQRDGGKAAGYVVLDKDDSSSLGSVLNDEAAGKLLEALRST